MMEILIVSPANYVTGGVELLHQLCFKLNKADDVNAMMWYWDVENVNYEQPVEYAEYGCRWVKDMPEGYNGVIIFPEIWANCVVEKRFKHCRKVIFWESVDNYFRHCDPKDYFKFAYAFVNKKEEVIHLAQSWYAAKFLDRICEKSILIGDYINDAFFKPYSETKRERIVLYNPKKGMEFTEKLMRYVGENIIFEPVAGMTREDVICLMRRSMLYIDFGDHPGRDRLPREAAMCGCCVITGRNGSADFYHDLPISDEYKFSRSEQFMPFINIRMREVLRNYDEHKKAFDYYRAVILSDKKVFEDQCRYFLSVLRKER